MDERRARGGGPRTTVAPRRRAAAIAREVAAVRTAAGLIDVSTLGKIEVMGRDAGELLDRLYNRLASPTSRRAARATR